MFKLRVSTCLFLCLLHLPRLSAAEPAQQAFNQGDFAQAIELWQQQQTQQEQPDTWLKIVQAYIELGLTPQAKTALEQAQKQLGHDHALQARWHVLHSEITLAEDHNQHPQALEYLQTALTHLPTLDDPLVRADILNHAGNIYGAGLDYEQAMQAYRDALAILKNTAAPDLLSSIQVNLARSQTQLAFSLAPIPAELSDFAESVQSLQAADKLLSTGDNRYQQVFAYLQINQLASQIQTNLEQPDAQVQQLIQHSIEQAVKLAEQLQNPAAQAPAYAALSRWYLQQKQFNAALTQVRRALFLSAQSAIEWTKPQWLRLQGQILHQQQQLDAALDTYRQAAQLLKPLRRRLANTGYRPPQEFREQIAPIYFERADLALKKATLLTGEPRKALLLEAREAIESFKQAELQDYFRSPCITANRDCEEQDFNLLIDDKTAVLYPMILPERLELLLIMSNEQLLQKTVNVSSNQLQDSVALLLSPLRQHPDPNEQRSRRASRGAQTADANAAESCKPIASRSAEQDSIEEKNRSLRFLPFAKQLYEWLIAPLEADLQAHGIENLIIVPDSVLRTMPFAALHNGKQYLIENYAIGVIPSLCLGTSSHALAGQLPKMLLGGISEAVQGFEALPCAEYELKTLHDNYAQQQPLLLNSNFQLSNLQRSVSEQDYAIVHIASHGEFNAAVDKSFILTYDGKLTLDKLEQLNQLRQVSDRPIELLTLSACETAKGNDRAALGLAGVSIKAGAKSVLASLWQVDDSATPAVLIEFYRQLQNSTNKVQALRQAQQQLLQADEYRRYRHPYYWAAFLLLGDWR